MAWAAERDRELFHRLQKALLERHTFIATSPAPDEPFQEVYGHPVAIYVYLPDAGIYRPDGLRTIEEWYAGPEAAKIRGDWLEQSIREVEKETGETWTADAGFVRFVKKSDKWSHDHLPAGLEEDVTELAIRIGIERVVPLDAMVAEANRVGCPTKRTELADLLWRVITRIAARTPRPVPETHARPKPSAAAMREARRLAGETNDGRDTKSD